MQRGKAIDGLPLSYDVQVSAPRQHQRAVSQKLDMAAELARRPAHPLGYSAELAQIRGVEGEDCIGLAQVAAPEHNGIGFIDLGGCHFRLNPLRYPLPSTHPCLFHAPCTVSERSPIPFSPRYPCPTYTANSKGWCGRGKSPG